MWTCESAVPHKEWDSNNPPSDCLEVPMVQQLLDGYCSPQFFWSRQSPSFNTPFQLAEVTVPLPPSQGHRPFCLAGVHTFCKMTGVSHATFKLTKFTGEFNGACIPLQWHWEIYWHSESPIIQHLSTFGGVRLVDLWIYWNVVLIYNTTILIHFCLDVTKYYNKLHRESCQ